MFRFFRMLFTKFSICWKLKQVLFLFTTNKLQTKKNGKDDDI